MSDKTKVVNSENANKKSTTLQAVKAVAVLVGICLVCCLLLAVCNDLLYISDEEKFNRALAKVYPGDFTVDSSFSTKPNGEFAVNNTFGSIQGVYKSTAGDYIILTKGVGGYGGGTVSLYVAVKTADATIVGWSIKDNEGQSFIGNITEKCQKTWYVGTRVDGDLSLASNKVQGTSLSSTAINNAINMAAYYCMNALNIGSNPVKEANDAVVALLSDKSEYASLTFDNTPGALTAKLGDATVASLLSDGDNTISYLFIARENHAVQAFVYGTDESRKVVVTNNGAVIAQSDNVAGTEEFVTNVGKYYVDSYFYSATSYTTYAILQVADIVEDGANKVYTVTGLKTATPDNYTLVVTITEENGVGKVVSVTVAENGNGFVDGMGAPAQADADAILTDGSLVGVTFATVPVPAKNGATQSPNLITVAVKAALAHFDAHIEQ